MAHPTVEDARRLSDWQPPLGVISVYLDFDPADRSAAWRTELKNGLERLLELAEEAEHEAKIAMRETAKRLLERFDDEETRPPPRGEAGFAEVSREPGEEHWFGTAVAPVLPALLHTERPVVAELVDLSRRGERAGVVLLSSERVRLLDFAEAKLEEIHEWELTILSLAWRGPKDHDEYDARLDENRHRFLVECGHLAGEALWERGLEEIVAFGPPADVEAFWKGFGSTPMRTELGGEMDLIEMPTGGLIDEVAAAIARLRAGHDREFVERVVAQVQGGSHGAAGVQDTTEALAEGRVEHLALDPAIGDPVEEMVRGALATDAKITIVRDGVAELLEPTEGVAALLRY